MKKFTLLIVAVLFALAGSVQAQELVPITADDFTIANGETKNLVVKLNYELEVGDAPLCGASFSLYLPDGIILGSFDSKEAQDAATVKNLTKNCNVEGIVNGVWGENSDNNWVSVMRKSDGGLLFQFLDLYDKAPFVKTQDAVLCTISLKAIADVTGTAKIAVQSLNNIDNVSVGMVNGSSIFGDCEFNINPAQKLVPITADDFVIANGETKDLVVKLNYELEADAVELCGAQFSLYLPDGIILGSFDSKEAQDAATTTDLKKNCNVEGIVNGVWGKYSSNGWVNVMRKTDGGLLIYFLPDNKEPFVKTQDAVLCTISLKAIADVTGTAKIANQSLHNIDYVSVGMVNGSSIFGDCEFNINPAQKLVPITADDFIIANGETKDLVVKLNYELEADAVELCGASFRLYLPDGIILGPDKINVEVENGVWGKYSSNSWVNVLETVDGGLFIYFLPDDKEPFVKTQDAVLCTISLKAIADVTGTAKIAMQALSNINSVSVGTVNGSSIFGDCKFNINIITFADANVKALCVANWDTDGDGELSTFEAAAVTSLGEVFRFNTQIVSFNELQYFTGLSSIGGGAFCGCTNLITITIPNSVTSIEDHIVEQGPGFNGLEDYYRGAFENCTSLTSITIPSSVSRIGSNAFSGCSGLTSVTIGNGVTSIGGGAFYGCINLATITIPNSVTCIENGTEIHSGGRSYITEYHGAFENCNNLTSVTIPNSVTSIGSNAFKGCSSLTSVQIGNGLTSIGGGAFYGCTNLAAVTIPNSVTCIEDCSHYFIVGWSGENTVNYGAFGNCTSLSSIIIPNSVTKIGSDAFRGCSGLTSVTIQDGVTSIGGGAFYGCTNLTKITIPNSVTCIEDHSADGDNGSGGDNRVCYGAFGNCTSLASVTIPNSVTSIGTYAFQGCSCLTSVTVGMETPPAITEGVFTNRANATLYVPAGCKAAYKAAPYWQEFKAIKEYPDRDVNQDGYTDVVDVVDIARYVVGTPANSFDVFLADLNSDKTVNVADAVVLVNYIAGDINWSRGMGMKKSEPNDMLALTENSDHSLSLQLEGDGRYTAFQFELYLPEDVDVTQMILNTMRRQKHQLLFNKVGEGQWRVVALSTSNRVFEGTAGELLNIALDGFATDDVRVDNIHFVTAQGTDVTFEAIGLSKNGTVTEVNNMPSVADSTQTVFSLDGQRLKAPKKGLNIIGGKKVFIK